MVPSTTTSHSASSVTPSMPLSSKDNVVRLQNITSTAHEVPPLVIECTKSSDANIFIKTLVLTYPQLKPNQFLYLKMETNVSTQCFQAARYFQQISCNVRIMSLNSNADKTNACTSEDPYLDNIENWLRTTSITDPFESGFRFPSTIPIELSDVGLNPEILSVLEEDAMEWKYHTVCHTPNENLGVMYVLFKRLLSDPEVPADLIISDQQLLWVLCVFRSLYKPHVPFHSYWHSVDVTQFTVLMVNRNPDIFRLCAAQKLALAIAAVGHDALHPGLMYSFISSIDTKFVTKYNSLESYHLEIFKKVLDQVWPSVKKYWGHIVEAAIDATELTKHNSYMERPYDLPKLSMEHAIKSGDLASCLRDDPDAYWRCSTLIFIELRNQSFLSLRMLDGNTCTPMIDTSRPPEDEFIKLQETFLKNLAVPYFKWLNERLPRFTQFYESSLRHLQQIEQFAKGEVLPPALNDGIALNKRF